MSSRWLQSGVVLRSSILIRLPMASSKQRMQGQPVRPDCSHISSWTMKVGHQREPHPGQVIHAMMGLVLSCVIIFSEVFGVCLRRKSSINCSVTVSWQILHSSPSESNSHWWFMSVHDGGGFEHG